MSKSYQTISITQMTQISLTWMFCDDEWTQRCDNPEAFFYAISNNLFL